MDNSSIISFMELALSSFKTKTIMVNSQKDSKVVKVKSFMRTARILKASLGQIKNME